MAIWCLCFCGMQWRAIGQPCAIPFNTPYGLFARWTRLGLGRRLLDRLRGTWRLICGDTPEPSTVVIAKACAACKVSNPGSPGPAPTSHTEPCAKSGATSRTAA
jgi:hypothetical protein